MNLWIRSESVFSRAHTFEGQLAHQAYPEGMKGLSLGFQPQVPIKETARPEGAEE